MLRNFEDFINEDSGMVNRKIIIINGEHKGKNGKILGYGTYDGKFHYHIRVDDGTRAGFIVFLPPSDVDVVR